MAPSSQRLFTPVRMATVLGLLLAAAPGAMAQSLLPPGTTIRVLAPDGLTIDGQGLVTGGVIEVRDGKGQGLGGVALTRRRINSAGVEQGSASGLATATNGVFSQGTLNWGTDTESLKGGANRYCLDSVPAAEAGQACVDVTVLGTVVTAVQGRKAYAVGGTDQAAAALAASSRANTAVSLQGVQLQMGHVQTRLRALRTSRNAGWVNDSTVQINGRLVPLSGSSGAGDSSPGGDSGGVIGSGWGGYVMGTLAVEEDKGSGSLSLHSQGLSVGADYRLSRKAVVGAALGGLRSKADVAGLADAQRARGTSLTVYGSYEPADRWYLDAALSLARNRFELQRATATGGRAQADTKGSGSGLSLTAGYQFLGQRSVVSPYLRAEKLRVKVDGYTETGDSPFTLGDQRVDANLVALGSEFQFIVPTRLAIVVPHARIEWQQQSQQHRDSGTATLVGADVQVNAQPALDADKRFGRYALGLSAQFRRGMSAFLDYEALFGKDDLSERRVNLGAKLEF